MLRLRMRVSSLPHTRVNTKHICRPMSRRQTCLPSIFIRKCAANFFSLFLFSSVSGFYFSDLCADKYESNTQNHTYALSVIWILDMLVYGYWFTAKITTIHIVTRRRQGHSLHFACPKGACALCLETMIMRFEIYSDKRNDARTWNLHQKYEPKEFRLFEFRKLNSNKWD